LVGHFGRESVFMDVDNVPFGVDFRDHLIEELGKTDLLLAVIGSRWNAVEKGGRRLEKANDYVRLEIATALKQRIPVIPILLDGTRMPGPTELPEDLQPLAFRNAADVDSGRDFHAHMDRLIKSIEGLQRPPRTPASPLPSGDAQGASDRSTAPITKPQASIPPSRPSIPTDPTESQMAEQEPRFAAGQRKSVFLALAFTAAAFVVVALLFHAQVGSKQYTETSDWARAYVVAGIVSIALGYATHVTFVRSGLSRYLLPTFIVQTLVVRASTILAILFSLWGTGFVDEVLIKDPLSQTAIIFSLFLCVFGGSLIHKVILDPRPVYYLGACGSILLGIGILIYHTEVMGGI
jgi:hypothetical protein